MKVQTERVPGSLARLEIEIEQEQLDRELDRAYKRLANRVQVPGFRRGKAPRVLVERALGEGAVLEEATRELVPSAISDAIEQERLDPIGEPEDFNLLGTEPLKFQVSIPLVPSVTLGDYHSVTAERQPVEVTDADVEEVIEQLRGREGEWVTPDPPRPAQEGDQLTLDIQDFVDDEPIAEPQEAMTVVVGQGPLMDEIDAQLVGVEEGREYDFDATLPEDHRLPEMAGKPARFHVDVKSIQERRLPEVDDAFAGRAVEGVESVAALRERIRENLLARRQSDEQERLTSDIVQKVADTAQVEVPNMLVEREVGHRIEHFEEGLRSSGIGLRQYLDYTNQTEEDMREEMREPARTRLLRGLVLGEVAKAEGIEVSDEEIDREVQRVAARIDEVERAGALEYLNGDEWRGGMRSQLYDRKLLSRLVEIATGEPLEDPDEAAAADPTPTAELADGAPTDADEEIEAAIDEVEAEQLVEELTAEERATEA